MLRKMMNKTMRKGKWGLILGLAVLTIALLNLGCRKRSKAGEKMAPSEAREQPEAVEVQKENAPVLGLMVNRLGEIDTFQGWPVLVELELRHPQLFQRDKQVESKVIASRGDSWAEAITLVVKNSKDQTMDFPFKLKRLEEAALTLDAEKMGSLSWWLASEDSVTIPEGDYRIIAKLDTSGVKKPGIWQGKVSSEPVVLHFYKEPAPLSEEQAEGKQLLFAACAKAWGDRAKAMGYVDTVLGARPESLQGLALKAGLLEEAGDNMAAMKTYEKAIAIFNRKYPNADPPYDLWDGYNRLVAELLKK
jgi:tetratricopeptide (TPR) repeat protein